MPGQAGTQIVGFELAEYEGCFYPAQAVVVGETVVLTCPEVKRPRLVRYAWKPYTRANLCNGAGLPASTFRAVVVDTSAAVAAPGTSANPGAGKELVNN